MEMFFYRSSKRVSMQTIEVMLPFLTFDLISSHAPFAVTWSRLRELSALPRDRRRCGARERSRARGGAVTSLGAVVAHSIRRTCAVFV